MENSGELYLECYNNKVGQILSVFSMFLYTTMVDSKDNRMLHNVFTESRRIYMRSLIDFFSDAKGRRDDLNYSDFVEGAYDFNVQSAEEFRNLTNKQTAHFTSKRGTFLIDDTEHMNVAKQLIRNINRFMEALESDIKEDCKQEYEDATVQKLRNVVLSQIAKICILNAVNGCMIEL